MGTSSCVPGGACTAKSVWPEKKQDADKSKHDLYVFIPKSRKHHLRLTDSLLYFFYLYKNILKKRVIAGKEGLYITTKAVADIFMIHICQS